MYVGDFFLFLAKCLDINVLCLLQPGIGWVATVYVTFILGVERLKRLGAPGVETVTNTLSSLTASPAALSDSWLIRS